MTIDWVQVTYTVDIILSLTVGAYSIYDAGKCPDKKRPFRLFSAVLCYYFAMLYLAALINPGYVLLQRGFLTSLGVMMALAVIGVEIYLSSHRGWRAARPV